MYCSSCGNHVGDNAAFCGQCGAPVNGGIDTVNHAQGVASEFTQGAPLSARTAVPTKAPPAERTTPAQVKRAVACFVASVILALIASLVDFNEPHNNMAVPGFFGMDALFIIVFWLVIYKIGKGRNWARITYLVLTVVGIMSTLLAQLPGASPPPSALDLAFDVVTTLLDLYGLWLVFTGPGSSWFARRVSRKVERPVDG